MKKIIFDEASIEEFREIYRRDLHVWGAFSGLSPEERVLFRQRYKKNKLKEFLEKRRSSAFVAKQGNKLIGYVFFDGEKLVKIFVEPKHRKSFRTGNFLEEAVLNHFRSHPELTEISGTAISENKLRQEALERWYGHMGTSKATVSGSSSRPPKQIFITRERAFELAEERRARQATRPRTKPDTKPRPRSKRRP